MNVNSSIFVILFVPLVILAFQLLPGRYKKWLTVLFNIIFLGFAGLGSLIVTCFVIFINFMSVTLMDKIKSKKLVLFLSITFNVLALALFKYSYVLNPIFFKGTHYLFWLQPIGVSFLIF